MSDTESASGGTGEVEAELSRDMGLWGITFIGIGAMIGAGVFALTGQAAGLAGPALMVAFLLNGIVASFTAMSYAELGSAFPRSGGAYNWVSEALPRPWGFFTGWANWFAQAVACALYAVTFGVFLMAFVSTILYGTTESANFLGFEQHLWAKGLSAFVVAFFGYVNYRGAEETGTIGIVVTSAKIVILGVFVVFGATATISDPNWLSKFAGSHGFFATGAGGVMAAMGFTYVAFEGYDIIVQSGEEVIDPGTNIPKAIFYSIVVVIPIYVLVAFAALGGIDVTAHILELAGLPTSATDTPTYQILGNLGELGIIQAAGQFVPYGLPLLLVAGIAATMSALNATLYASSRIAFSMSRDKLLPDALATIHPDTRSPYLAIVLSAALIAAMAVSLPINSVASSSSVMFLLLFSMVNIAVIAMRRNRPDLDRPFSVPFFPYTPALGVVFQLILAPFLLQALGLQPGFGEESQGFISLVTMLVWFALGVGVYYSYAQGRELERMEAETPTVVTEHAAQDREYQIVVPVSNPENVEQFMRTAIDLARENEGEILVMSVVTVPQQTPIEEGRKFASEKREVIDEAMAFADDANVPVSGTIRIGHDVSTAILNTIEQERSDAVLMGWRGRGRRRDAVLGSNVDAVVQNAACDVFVEKIGTGANGKVDSILLPAAGGPHAELAATAARAIAHSEDAPVTLLRVVEPGEDEPPEDLLDDVREALGDVTVEVETVTATDVADAIVDAAADHDVTLIGATREGLLQQLVFGAIPEEVGRRAESTVIMAKKNLGITSRLRRILQWA